MQLLFILPLLPLAKTATRQQIPTNYWMEIYDSGYTVFKDSLYDNTQWPMNTSTQQPFPFFASRVQRKNLSTFIKDTFYRVGQSERDGPYKTNHKNLYIFQSPKYIGVITIYDTRWQMVKTWVYGEDKTSLTKT